MILGCHLILSAYGFWLPNDPRGSWSHTVRSFELLQHGRSTKTDIVQSVADRLHDQRARRSAKRSLTRPPVVFTGLQARAIARGIAIAVEERSYVVFALAVLPDHVHVIVKRHMRDIGMIASHLKAKATMAMSREGIHPCLPLPNGQTPTPWARNYWAPYIRTRRHMLAAIEYVSQNPVKLGLRGQRWNLVSPYE